MNKSKNKTRKIKHADNTEKIPTYGEIEYNSNDGMLTTVWGPSVWHYLHTLSFNYPVKPTMQDKKHYRDYILLLEYVLPCGKCRKNLYKNFKKLPLTMKQMESRATFSRYIYDLHEVVNKMLCKKSNLTYDDVKERYEHFRSRCTKSLNKIKIRKTIKKRKKEKGCTEPLYGEKSKCILRIVPQKEKCETLEIDNKCIKKRESMLLEEKSKNKI
jgi:hypothetical protein